MKDKRTVFIKELQKLLEKHGATIIADNFYSGNLTLQAQFKNNPEINTVNLNTYCDSESLNELLEN